MAYTHAERLSALDSSFLELEDENAHMHIGMVALFDAAPLTRPGGGIDIERIRALTETTLYRVPRYRQRIVRVPVVGHPVWIDDTRFNLAYHVRHTHLPHPGDERQLKRLAGRLMSQALDRGKPLWEMWVVEGVEGNRFAIITKAHHCMIDGVGSVELTSSVMSALETDPRLEEPPPRWVPRPAPGPLGLLVGELRHRAEAPWIALGALRDAARAPRRAAHAFRETMAAIGEAIAAGFRPASPTPLNVEIGPHRRFDWTSMDLAAVKDVKKRLGGTVNDVVLAVLTGAVRRFLRRRGLTPERLDFRAMIPVNVRNDENRRELGNRVAMMVARLPLEQRDPRTRLHLVVEETQRLKHSRQAAGVKALEELSDASFTTLFVEFGRLAARSRPFNVVVTNVPGPQYPVYVLGATMQACYPLVPLYQNQALGIALFSYDGRLYWGFNADWDAVPDLHDLVDAVNKEFDAIAAVAAAAPRPTLLRPNEEEPTRATG